MKKLNRTKSTIWARAAVTALCAVLTTAASWADRQWTSNECTVTLADDGTLTVSKSGGSGRMADYGLDVNDNYVYPEWHAFVCNIKSIVISEGVTAIGSSAFFDCAAARTATISASVTYIGDDAFYDCVELLDVFCYADPDELTWIDDKTNDFVRTGTKSTKCHVYEENLGKFQSKFGNVNVTFFGDLRDYTGPWKSGDCTVTLDDNGKLTVVKNAGSGDGRMADYTSAAPLWCRYAENIKTVVFSAGVTSIGSKALYDCKHLETVVISENVTDIGNAAFYRCTSLYSIIIPEGVTSLGMDAFLGCTNLADVYCYANPANLYWTDVDCDDFMANKATNCHVKGSLLTSFISKFGENAITKINVTFVGDLKDNPEDGLAIDAKNFPDAKFRQFLHNFEMNNGDDYLSDAERSLIVSLNVSGLGIGDLTGLEFFPRLSWLDCSNNQLATLDVTKNDRLEELYCQGNQLTTLDLSGNVLLSSLDCSLNRISAESMKALISSLHYRKSSFIAINLDNPAEQNEVNRANVLAAQEKKWTINCIKDGVETAYEGGDISGSWVTGECTATLTADGTLTVTGEGDMGDYRNASDAPWYGVRQDIKAINLARGVTGIGNNAFNECINLTSITIPQGVSSIGSYAFFSGINSNSLQRISLPASIQVIGQDAFYGSKAVEEVYIYGNPDEMRWGEKNYDDDDFRPGKGTVCHVRKSYLETFQSKFADVNLTFVGDLEDRGWGDVSSDGKLDGEDVSLLVGYMTGRISFRYLDLEDADLNNDNWKNIVDVVRLIDKIAQQ